MPLTQPKTDLAYLRSEKAKAEQQLRYYQGEKDRTMQVEYYGVKLQAGFKLSF